MEPCFGDGTVLWKIAFTSYATRLEVNDGQLFATGARHVVALDLADGHSLWSSASSSGTIGAEILATDSMVLVTGVRFNDIAQVSALDAVDGHFLWQLSADFGIFAIGYDIVPNLGRPEL
jgi:outer membrane protein assembly factor BamB